MQAIIEKRCHSLLKQAVDEDATDIHIRPESAHYAVHFRTFQTMEERSVLPFDLGDRMIAYFKYLSLLDMSERRKPQTGSFQQAISGIPCYFRLSTLPSVLTRESAVIRVISSRAAQPLNELAAFRDSARLLEKLSASPQGLILLTGPTGCGKSTTLYALLNHLKNRSSRHIITLEDPVERKNEELLQIQVNEKAGLSYSAGLKAILRHDPDVIMIGEIRDSDTAKIAVRAALTGHLVLSTIHARHSVGCLHRLADLGVSFEEMAQTLIAVSAQRIVPVRSPFSQTDLEYRALYEILFGSELETAVGAAAQQKLYLLPERETFAGQIREGVKIGALDESCETDRFSYP